MRKLSVSEYASMFNVSVQRVYQKIKRQSLKSVEENGVKYVLLDEKEFKTDLKPKVESDCKDLLKLIKSQQKEIKRLTKKNEKINDFLITKYETALPKPKPREEEEIIDIDTKPKKKKKKKKK